MLSPSQTVTPSISYKSKGLIGGARAELVEEHQREGGGVGGGECRKVGYGAQAEQPEERSPSTRGHLRQQAPSQSLSGTGLCLKAAPEQRTIPSGIERARPEEARDDVRNKESTNQPTAFRSNSELTRGRVKDSYEARKMKAESRC